MQKINIKKVIILLSLLFLIYTLLVSFIPAITLFDSKMILYIQDTFSFIPIKIIKLCDLELYSTMIIIQLLVAIIYFFKKYLLIDMVIFPTIPLVAYLINIVIKNIIQRPRPPIDLHLSIHPESYSYVSSHTLVTFCLCALSIYYLNLYCKNTYLKFGLIITLILWIIFEAFSRIWLGVHYPSDVLGAFLLGIVILFLYVKFVKAIGGKI